MWQVLNQRPVSILFQYRKSLIYDVYVFLILLIILEETSTNSLSGHKNGHIFLVVCEVAGEEYYSKTFCYSAIQRFLHLFRYLQLYCLHVSQKTLTIVRTVSLLTNLTDQDVISRQISQGSQTSQLVSRAQPDKSTD